jgi:gliding motility-associated-like protein
VPQYGYAWSANAGSGNSASASNLPAGSYSITVTDKNNCTVSKTLAIDNPDTLILKMEPKDPTCFNGDDGWIASAVTGGVPQYLYSWNDGGWTDADTATGVLTGMYVLAMKDANGCVVHDTAWITEPAPVVANVTPELDTLIFGDSVTLVSSYHTTANGGVTYSWEPADDLSCTNCPEPIASPLFSTTYRLTIADANGCIATKEAEVFVDNVRPLFVPNVFTPDGNFHNDTFRPYASGVRTIDFQIFDRWGSMVYYTTDINQGWDGTYKGKLLSPDVFVYYLKVTYMDGKERDAKGSVTLIR